MENSVVSVPSSETMAVTPLCTLPSFIRENMSYQNTCHVPSVYVTSTAGRRVFSRNDVTFSSFLEYSTAFSGESIGGSFGPRKFTKGLSILVLVNTFSSKEFTWYSSYTYPSSNGTFTATHHSSGQIAGTDIMSGLPVYNSLTVRTATTFS